MLSPKTKRNISRIIPFGVIWLIFSIVYTLLEKGLLGNLDYYPSTGNSFDFARNIFATPISAFITGLLIGALEILYFNKWFIQKSFSKKILFKSVASMNITLDGFCDHTAVIADEELHQNANELLRNADTLLFRRVTYQLMEAG